MYTLTPQRLAQLADESAKSHQLNHATRSLRETVEAVIKKNDICSSDFNGRCSAKKQIVKELSRRSSVKRKAEKERRKSFTGLVFTTSLFG